MKASNKILLIFWICYISLAPAVYGQIRYGSIEYEITINLEKRFPPKHQVPGKYGASKGQKRFSGDNKYLVEQATLYFNDTMSVYVTKPLESVRDLNRTFLTSTQIDFKNHRLETQINLFGEDFIIHDSLPNRIWKFTSKERMIAGKMAKQAITQINDSTLIFAWFDTDFSQSIGPESFWDLPGAILGLAYEDGSVTYFATKINTDHLDLQNKIPSIKERKLFTRNSFISEFKDKYASNHQYYQLIKDMLHFF